MSTHVDEMSIAQLQTVTPLTIQQVIDCLGQTIQQHQNYLRRRRGRGTATPTDALMQQEIVALAQAIYYLEVARVPPPPTIPPDPQPISIMKTKHRKGANK